MLEKPWLRLLLVRHGQTLWNETGRCLGRRDLPLTPLGRESVTALASYVDFSGCREVYSSPASRAVETAGLLLNGSSRPVAIVEDLCEIDFGAWEGLTWREICLLRSKEWRSWQQDPIHSAPYQGESLGEVAGRMTRIYQEFLARHKDESVLVIGHGGSLNILLCELFRVPLNVLWAFDLQPASLSELVVYPEGPILTLLNCSPHVRLTSNSIRAAVLQ